MSDRTAGMLRGLRVLVVEDEPLVALALADDLENAGATVIGPASTVDSALALLTREAFEAAVLDIKLQNELVFPVADALMGQGVPFIFTTGFDAGAVPAHYVHVPKCEKPSSTAAIMDMLAALTGRDLLRKDG